MFYITYDPAEISPSTGTPLSAVRFLLQDTINGEAQFEDGEILAVYNDTNAALTQEQRVYLTAALLAEALLTRFSTELDFSSGGTSIQHSKRVQSWKGIAQRLASQASELIAGSALEVLNGSRTSTF